jgi:dipeptidyl aminopeptidase/acylaminoacyl peptidase
MTNASPLTTLLRSGLALTLVLPLAAEGAKAPAATSKGHLPPLVDREKFFGNPEIAGAQISPDGKWIAYLKPYKETRNVWVKRVGESYEQGHLVTADPKRPIPGFFWSRDGKYILFVQDHEGDENFNVYAVDPAAQPAPGKDAPEARNLTAAKGVNAMIYAVPKAEPDVIFVGLNDREAAWHDVYKVKISTGERTLLRKNTERIAGWVFDKQANLRLALRTTDKGDTEILRVDPEGFTKIYDCNVFEAAGPVQFHPDGKRVYLETNKGDRDLSELVLFDPATGKEEKVESDPKKQVDFGTAIFSELTDELIATVYEGDRTRIYWKNKVWEADYNLLKKKLPGREIHLVSSTADEQVWLIAATSDQDPGSCYRFDRKTKKLTMEYISRKDLPRQAMATMQPIHFTSSDGLDIPAYLTLPKGVPAKNLPLIVNPHGGPWYRDSWRFNNEVQFLANRGYAVLQPNFRGSTGYGKKFLNAGNRQWGDKMQDDITWGVKALIAKGIADPKRVGIYGGSYGGYATLAGVTFTPSLYAAAVDYVGVSNLITFQETIPAYWEAFRTILKTRVGDPATPEGKQQLERQSPINSANKIITPLLVVQGANDPRVNKAESDQIVISLRDRHYPVAYLCAPDEGHGFHRPVNSMAMYAATEKFMAQYLHGRYQEGGTPEVMARLKEITVDPVTVVLAKKAGAATAVVPTPVAKPTAGTFTFAGTIAAGPQSFPISMVRTVKEEGGTWVVSDAAKLPGGEALDTTTLAKDTLVPLKRQVKQGPVTIEMAFEGAKATGTMAMGGAPKAFSVELGGGAFAEGSGAEDALACLPLAEGYTVVFRNVDLQRQKVQLKRAKVLGQEPVTVPAGTFKAWKVELTSAEGEPGQTTLWVDTVTRKVLKTIATLPQMGGAVVTVELQP